MDGLGKVAISGDTGDLAGHRPIDSGEQTLTLPKLTVGDRWLGKNDELQMESAVVDKVRSLVGGTCTVFQRMTWPVACFACAPM